MAINRRQRVEICPWLGRVLFGISCACVGATGGCTQGFILVGQPEVFTRARLIDARYEDHEWLRAKLDGADQAVGFQGFIDQKILDITVAKVEAEYKALSIGTAAETEGGGGGETQPAEGQQNPAGSEGSSTTSQGEVRDALRGTEVASGSLAAITHAELTPIDQLNDQLAYRAAVRGAMRQTMVDDSHDLTGGMLYDLKFDVTIQPGGNSQHNAIILFTIVPDSEKRDWSHPYSDSYDSRKQARQYFVRAFEYGKWGQSVEREMNELSLELQRKLERGTLSSTDSRWLVRAIQALGELEPSSVKQPYEALDIQAEWISDAFSDARQVLMGADAGQRQSVDIYMQMDNATYRGALAVAKYAIAKGVAQFYDSRLRYVRDDGSDERPLLLIDQDNLVQQAGFWYIRVRPGDSTALYQLNVVIRSLGQRYKREQAIVVDTQPKEQAQNISDVGAGRHILNFLAAFSGNVSSNLSLGADYERYLDEQIMLQAIKRRALVIGFNNSENQFGYILGPQFEIQRKDTLFQRRIEPGFKHRATRYTVGATLIAPVWMRYVTLSYKTYWVDHAGQASVFRSKGVDGITGEGKVVIPLATDYRALSRAIMFGPDIEPLQPLLYDTGWSSDDRYGEYSYSLEADQEGELLIRGTELWRNPQVFVGSQRADWVTVLADMNSLHASFGNVEWPGGEPAKPAKVDLTVVTSYGAAVLEKAVLIYPAAEREISSPALLLDEKGWTLKNQANEFEIAFTVTKPMPPGFAGIQLQLREAATLTDFAAMRATLVRPKPEEIIFRIDVDDQDQSVRSQLLNSTRALEVRPVLQLVPGGQYIPIELGDRKHLVYFSDADHQKLEVTGVSKNTVIIKGDRSVTPAAGAIQLPSAVSTRLFEQYVPQFMERAWAGEVRLVLTPLDTSKGAQRHAIALGPLDPATREMTIDFDAAVDLLSDVVGGEPDKAGANDAELALSFGEGVAPEILVTRWKINREKKQ